MTDTLGSEAITSAAEPTPARRVMDSFMHMRHHITGDQVTLFHTGEWQGNALNQISHYLEAAILAAETAARARALEEAAKVADKWANSWNNIAKIGPEYSRPLAVIRVEVLRDFSEALRALSFTSPRSPRTDTT
jgi:hypothetical protein